jgi:hypothetical protein
VTLALAFVDVNKQLAAFLPRDASEKDPIRAAPI